MKKTMKMLTLVLALGICMSPMSFAFGEGEAPAAVEQTQEASKPAEEKAVKEEPKAEAAQEEPKSEAPKAEAPAEAPAGQDAAAEQTEVQTEVASEASGEDLVEIEDSETPLGLFDTAAPFEAAVKVERKGEGALYYGDRVTLTAQVSNANRMYAIRWEVNRQDDEGWKAIAGASGADYSFALTEENVNYEYRVVLESKA